MKTALIQMRTVLDKTQNMADAVAQIAAAAQQGADLAVLPEMFCCPYQHKYFRPYAEPAGGAVWQALSDAARANHIWVVGGTFPELDGESDTLTPGSELTLFDTEFGKIGVCVCFDIRFPELFLLMSKAGAQAVIIPAAFNNVTGAAHWELLLRSRAMDAQLFTAGVCPARNEKGYIAYGHSLACSPWGEILAEADYAPEMLLVQMDLQKVQDTRDQLPLFPARRNDLYQLNWLK